MDVSNEIVTRRPSNVKTLIMTARPPFLLLVFSCLALPISMVWANGQAVSATSIVVLLIAGVAAHISVNMLNEAEDFCSGLDMTTQRTPFSGGSGGLPDNPSAHTGARVVGYGFLTISVLASLYLLYVNPQHIALLMVLGCVGIFLIVTYTRYLNRTVWLCLIAPGLAFGPVMVIGGALALGSALSAQVLIASLVPFFLVNNLLLLNQYPDRAADMTHGRKHVVVVYGYQVSTVLLAIQWCLAIAVIVAGISMGALPLLSLICLVLFIPLWFTYKQAGGYTVMTNDMVKAMGINVAVTLLVPLILAITICVDV